MGSPPLIARGEGATSLATRTDPHEEVTDGRLLLEEGTLYPALHRLERRRLIAAEWGLSENKCRAKYYQINDRGRQELHSGESLWRRYAVAVHKVLETS